MNEAPRIRPLRLVIAWLLSAASVFVAAWIVPGVAIEEAGGALVAAAVIAALNAVLPPLLAALRLPFTLVLGLLLVLVLDAAMFLLCERIAPGAISVDSFGSALGAAFATSAVSVALDPLFRMNDDDAYMLRVTRRIARRTGGQTVTDVPGIVFLEIDGLGLPVLRRAMRDGSAPHMARWVAEEGYTFTPWETDLSSQTGASQAGILLGSNDDIPAFRWIEKANGRTMTCSKPADCAEIEQRLSTGGGLLRDGGASRGNLLSGDAEHVILTVSRMAAEKHANPGYRAFFANGFNVTRVLVLCFWEVVLEWTAAIRSARRDVRPRGHRGGAYPFIRAVMCVVVRDLIVFGVISDLMKGRPAVYATFSSYDEVAHHSGLERADTLEALRKLDQQFDRIARARHYAPRPYEIVVLSDHGQTQGATFLQRNGYSLADLVNRSLSDGEAESLDAGDENAAMVGHAMREATTGVGAEKADAAPAAAAAVLASGNLGLIYLTDESQRLTLEEIEMRHPRLLSALREHSHIGFALVHSAARGPVALGRHGANYLREHAVEGGDPLEQFGANAARHLMRTDGFPHAPDILVNSFYDPQLEEGCAFEELISFHGGLGGTQTRPFILHPGRLPVQAEPLIGAAAVHDLLNGWRASLQGGAVHPEWMRPPLSRQATIETVLD
ncbi:MAG: phage holin family protein [Gaiellaceae bacterium]